MRCGDTRYSLVWSPAMRSFLFVVAQAAGKPQVIESLKSWGLDLTILKLVGWLVGRKIRKSKWWYVLGY